MEQVRLPVMLYDDRCGLCGRFARVVDALAGGRLTILGHYTPQGERVRRILLEPSATQMFWVVGRQAAYGGRRALLPLIHQIITARGGLGMVYGRDPCSDGCSVLVRSASLLTMGRKIVYDPVTEV